MTIKFGPISLLFDAPELDSRLSDIDFKLTNLLKQGEIMTAELQALQAEVANATQVEASAVALIQGLATQIAALKDDPAALQALSDSLKAGDTSLAAAITANTPATPAV